MVHHHFPSRLTIVRVRVHNYQAHPNIIFRCLPWNHHILYISFMPQLDVYPTKREIGCDNHLAPQLSMGHILLGHDIS
jgi:hypothetical protein